MMLFRKPSISNRLLFWFLLIALLPLVSVPFVTYQISKAELKDALKIHLTSIAHNRARQVESYAIERKRDIAALSRMPLIAEILAGQTSAGIDSASEGMIRTFIKPYVEGAGYNNFLLIDASGTVRFSLLQPAMVGTNLNAGVYRDSELMGVFERAKTLMESEISDFEFLHNSKEPVAFIAAPVFSQGLVSGVVAIELSNRDLARMVSDYSGLGLTGETVIAARDEQEVVVVAPTRHDSRAAFHKRFPIGGNEGLPSQKAVLGTKGALEDIDYRGRQVMAVWRYLPSFRWGLVVKMDTKEAYAPIYKQRNAVVIVAILVLFFVVLVARFVSRSISQPISSLTEAVQRLSDGDLRAETAGKIKINSRDEVGILSAGFLQMINNLLTLIKGVQLSGIQVTTSSTQIAAAAKQLEATVAEQAASTNQVMSTAREITLTSRNLAENMKDVSSVAEETSSLAQSGRSGLSGMENSMRQLVAATAAISSRLAVLTEKANNISAVISTINKVADQTNLLSLNAAIEAEKAGEYGLGFAVVATEIRRLADQTAIATLDIEQMVKEMQSAVAAGVMSMDKFAEGVRRGAEDVATVGKQLTQIIEQVQTLAPYFSNVTEATLSQSLGAEQISESMVQLNESAQQTAHSLHEFNKITEQLNNAARGLQSGVSQFKVN